MKNCWICGNTATTGEHKIKKSDLERVHGSGRSFTSAGLSYLKSDQRIVPLQGPDSKHVKFEGVLCGPCNNAKSQPFDRAYDQFAKFVDSQANTLLQRRQIDFAAIYGTAWREQQANLFKYFVKAFGCRIADAGSPVPRGLVDVFSDQYTRKSFAICFAVDENEIDRPAAFSNRLGIGNLIHSIGVDAEAKFTSSGRYRWLLISYWYNWGPYGPMGEPWHRDQQFVCLGSYRKEESGVQVRRDDGSFFDWLGVDP